MPVLPGQLALTNVADGALIIASEHRNNYAAIQTAMNSLLSILDDGASGQVLTGVGTTLTWGPAAHATYAPVWTATGTAPAIGNGTITGKYLQIGKLIHCWGSFVAGSTTTYGTGSYRFTLPITENGTGGNLYPIGHIAARDASTGNMIQCQAVVSAATTFRGLYLAAMPIGAPTEIAQTTPWTWADTDAIYWNLVYEAT